MRFAVFKIMGNLRFRGVIFIAAIAFISIFSYSYSGGADAGQEIGSDNSLKMFLKDYIKKNNLSDDKTVKYALALVDLLDNGDKEAIIYFMGSDWCGTGGCITLILAPDESSYRIVTKMTIVHLPIRVLSSKTNGWHDLGVWEQGGGIQPGYEALLAFDGKTYPSNPSMPPARPITTKSEGEVVIPVTAKAKPLYE